LPPAAHARIWTASSTFLSRFLRYVRGSDASAPTLRVRTRYSHTGSRNIYPNPHRRLQLSAKTISDGKLRNDWQRLQNTELSNVFKIWFGGYMLDQSRYCWSEIAYYMQMSCFNCYINNNYTIIIILSDATAYTRQGLASAIHWQSICTASHINQISPRDELNYFSVMDVKYILLTYLTQWPEFASELHWPSNRRLSAKLVPTFADRGCQEVSVTDPCGRIFGFLDRSRYFFFQVAPQLYSRGWVDTVPDPLLLRKSGSTRNQTPYSGSVARNADHNLKVNFFYSLRTNIEPRIAVWET
jgi:hypothetical protein